VDVTTRRNGEGGAHLKEHQGAPRETCGSSRSAGSAAGPAAASASAEMRTSLRQASGDVTASVSTLPDEVRGVHLAARNLVPGDGNGALDVFVGDLVRGVTPRVSLAAGAEASIARVLIYSASPTGGVV
jgi:hypothetical protein